MAGYSQKKCHVFLIKTRRWPQQRSCLALLFAFLQKSLDLNLWKVSSLNSLRGKCCAFLISVFAVLSGPDVVSKFNLSAACPHYPCSWSSCGRQAACMSGGGHAVCSWVCPGLLLCSFGYTSWQWLLCLSLGASVLKAVSVIGWCLRPDTGMFYHWDRPRKPRHLFFRGGSCSCSAQGQLFTWAWNLFFSKLFLTSALSFS